MLNTSDIDKAIAAHGMWKVRLKVAIDTGKTEYDIATVRTDNHCDFGKWFYSLPESDRNNADAKQIQQLHASFHVAASQVLTMATSGKKTEALEEMGTKGHYTNISSQLTSALLKWKSSIK